ncbi:regulatory protein recX [Trifolium pratense]|uniref:Regulatory protein recX n=1 Tax=Trifolium pratense TaxID=57577 RepID=A0A2K3M5E2_TRIPR|nr:regulatory protein recX [Trifolium pratense]
MLAFLLIGNHAVLNHGSEKMEEVGELTGDSCEQDFVRVDKFTNDAEQSAVKLLAYRLFPPSRT